MVLEPDVGRGLRATRDGRAAADAVHRLDRPRVALVELVVALDALRRGALRARVAHHLRAAGRVVHVEASGPVVALLAAADVDAAVYRIELGEGERGDGVHGRRHVQGAGRAQLREIAVAAPA